MNTTYVHKLLVLTVIFSMLSCKVKKQDEPVIAKADNPVKTEAVNEENPYVDPNEQPAYETNFDAYFKYKESQVILMWRGC